MPGVLAGCGSFLIFAAFVLLLVSTSTSPIIPFFLLPLLPVPTPMLPPRPQADRSGPCENSPRGSRDKSSTDTAVSAPIFRPISLLDVYTGGQRSTFGVFGYCVGGGSCSNRGLGYNLPGVIANLAGTSYSNQNIVRLTRALVLHPIACGTSLPLASISPCYLSYHAVIVLQVSTTSTPLSLTHALTTLIYRK